MHELPVVEQVLSIATEHARRADATRITQVNLVIGALSSFVDDSIQFYFDFLTKGTMAEGATLSIRRVEARVRCRDCGGEFGPDGVDWCCPSCGSLGGDVVAGKEMFIETIEVE
jgi:hydrogenase nickel incorporation protein HypA/HybF